VGRTKSAIKPARMRSDMHKFGDRCRERVTIQELVLEDKGLRNYGTDAARTEQAGQGSKEMDKKSNQSAHRRIVAGREILKEIWAKQQFASHRCDHQQPAKLRDAAWMGGT